ncbi:hypothetical protein CLIB1423_08S01442 [[Candida] railenensis]|uniref:Uncharacterized protein n=1 Tax=[Candida] railenensis TaxID=45579 RepID=A0A9P0QQE3_9ASCO|nr:hypothetical protein CLIB1423_08S01442 [[Candida] railenensis]
MDFNSILKKGEEFVQSQNKGDGKSGSGENQYGAYAKDAETVYNDFQKEGTLSERAQQSYKDVSANHKQSSTSSEGNTDKKEENKN